MDFFTVSDKVAKAMTEKDHNERLRLGLLGHYANGLEMKKVIKHLFHPDDTSQHVKFQTLMQYFDKAKEKDKYELITESTSPKNP